MCDSDVISAPISSCGLSIRTAVSSRSSAIAPATLAASRNGWRTARDTAHNTPPSTSATTATVMAKNAAIPIRCARCPRAADARPLSRARSRSANAGAMAAAVSSSDPTSTSSPTRAAV